MKNLKNTESTTILKGVRKLKNVIWSPEIESSDSLGRIIPKLCPFHIWPKAEVLPLNRNGNILQKSRMIEIGKVQRIEVTDWPVITKNLYITANSDRIKRSAFLMMKNELRNQLEKASPLR